MKQRHGSNRPEVINSYVLACSPLETLKHRLESIPVTDSGEVWLSQTKKVRRHCIIGVPAKRVSVLITDTEPTKAYEKWVVRVTIKKGRYDGSVREEIVFTHWASAQCQNWDTVYPVINLFPSTAVIRFTTDPCADKPTQDRCDLWFRSYDRLKSDLSDYDPYAIVMWHRERYYKFLNYRDVEESVIPMFKNAWNPNTWTLNEANRVASRMLYEFARSQGYKKLERHVQQALGLVGQWHLESVVDAAKSRVEREGKCGVGEFTTDAANGKVPIYGHESLLAIAEDWAERHGLDANIRKHVPLGAFADWLRERNQDELADAVEAEAKKKETANG